MTPFAHIREGNVAHMREGMREGSKYLACLSFSRPFAPFAHAIEISDETMRQRKSKKPLRHSGFRHLPPVRAPSRIPSRTPVRAPPYTPPACGKACRKGGIGEAPLKSDRETRAGPAGNDNQARGARA